MSQNKIVWFIDENPDARKTYVEILQGIYLQDVTVLPVEPKPTIIEMKYIVDNPDTASIVIDEKLKDTGVALYFGIQLAEYFRSLNDKIPIYILTSYSGDYDLEKGKWSVEYIIDKNELTKDLNTIKARLQRNMSIYYDCIDEREHRFNELLKKSLEQAITKEEATELENLQYIRARNILADELGSSVVLEEKVKQQLELLDKLEKGIKHD